MFKLADDFKLFKGDCFNILPKFKASLTSFLPIRPTFSQMTDSVFKTGKS